MTFKPAIWKPIAVVLGAVNVAAVGVAAGASEPVHASIHAVLAVAFGLWAQRLGQGQSQGRGGSEVQTRVEEIEAELSDMRRELSETQERLDFAERVLAKAPETRRVGPEP
jgi:hypothetical protein